MSDSRLGALEKQVEELCSRLDGAEKQISELHQQYRDLVLANIEKGNASLAIFTEAQRRRKKNALAKESDTARKLLTDSSWFDSEQYLINYPDVARKQRDPLLHYLAIGASQGCNPSVKFDTTQYLVDNPDVAAAGVNPLLHYLAYGTLEGRTLNFLSKVYGACFESAAIRRSQSVRKHHIVVIDQEIPKFDTSAGARHTYQYVCLLAKMGFAVTFLPHEHSSGLDRYHLQALRDAGVTVFDHPAPFLGQRGRVIWQAWLYANREVIDTVYMHRPHVAGSYIDFCHRHLKAAKWYMCHDLHQLRLSRQAHFSGKKGHKREASAMKALEHNAFSLSDVLFTPSGYERAYLEESYPDKTVMALPLYIHDHVIPGQMSFPGTEACIFVGGIAHAPNKDAVSWFLESIWPRVLEQLPNAVVHIVGKGTEVYEPGTGGDKSIRIHGYIDDRQLNALYRQCRAVVAPMRFGAGVKGKVLEAMELGIPVVGTGCAFEGIGGIETLQDAGFRGDDEQSFSEALIRVFTASRNEWYSTSTAVQQIIADHFNAARARALIEKALSSDKAHNAAQ